MAIENKDFEPNSNKYKKEKVVTPPPTNDYTKKSEVVKKSGGQKILSAIFAGTATDIKSKIIYEVIVPQTKKLLLTMIDTAANTLFYGSGTSASHSSSTSKTKYTNYATISSSTRSAYENRAKTYEYNDIRFQTREDAEAALYDLKTKLSANGIVTVADWFQICNKPFDYTANSYGWHNLSNTKVIEAYGGWIVYFPEALAIEY